MMLVVALGRRVFFVPHKGFEHHVAPADAQFVVLCHGLIHVAPFV